MTTGRNDEPGDERTESGPASPGAAEEDGGAPGPDPEAAVSADLDALADVQRERDEYLELAQRARADFENFRKRAAIQVSDAERRGKSGIARELVPVIDNLERALSAAADDDPLRKGVEMVRVDLTGVLERAGIESYEPTGEPFDPSVHEALSTRAVAEQSSGTVVETVERGYRIDGQVIRPARVVVAE